MDYLQSCPFYIQIRKRINVTVITNHDIFSVANDKPKWFVHLKKSNRTFRKPAFTLADARTIITQYPRHTMSVQVPDYSTYMIVWSLRSFYVLHSKDFHRVHFLIKLIKRKLCFTERFNMKTLKGSFIIIKLKYGLRVDWEHCGWNKVHL